MFSKSRLQRAAFGALLVVAGACTDLAVTNPNEPDKERALRTGADIEALIAGTFRMWWDLQQGNAIGLRLSNETRLSLVLAYAGDVGAGNGFGGSGGMAFDPRRPVFNDNNNRWGDFIKASWFALYRGMGSMRDGLQSIAGGVRIGVNGADTPRLQAFAKLMQGLDLGHLSLIYDQGYVFDENTQDLSTVKLVPYKETLAGARAFLAKARDLSSKSTFTIPQGWMGQRTYTNQDLIRIAHSYEARFMAQVARTPAERAAVNWAEVLSHIERGVTQDFGVQLSGPGGFWRSGMKERYYMLLAGIGPADQSGGWQTWEKQDPTSGRLPFLIDTDDRRVTGGTPTSAGSLYRYTAAVGGDPDRGIYLASNYELMRWADLSSTSLGFAPDLTVKEMEFLKAEALIRLGRPAEALPFINKTRVENGKLPPATVNGVSGPRCVPRTITGACGNLLETLAWERRMEMILQFVGSEYYEQRGMGTLRKGNFLSLPVPAKELFTLGLPIYTTGGVGGPQASPGPVGGP
jgi:hypothetical protein